MYLGEKKEETVIVLLFQKVQCPVKKDLIVSVSELTLL